MNSEERQLITDLFQRMQGHGPVEKDPDAARLIADEVRRIPDAPYMLVQSVLVQEMALQQANARIEEMEARIADLERVSRPPAAQSGGSFLGGLFGSSRNPEPVPASRRASPAAMAGGRPAPGQARAAPASPWGQPQGMGQQPMAAGGGGGSFMRSAMATAAGVAGGMLLADGIRSMMSGDSASAATETAAANDTATAEPVDHQDPADNDPGVQDAGYDAGGGDWGGGDFGGGDFEV